MKKILIAILFVTNFCHSQEKIPFVDYTEIVQKVTEEEGSEKKLALINKISKNDSAYYSILISKSYHLLQLGKYEEALNVANEGINDSHELSKANFYINKGVAFTNSKKRSRSLRKL